MNKRKKIRKIIIIAIIWFIAIPRLSLAAQPPGVTTSPYTVSYSGRLTNASGNAITTAQNIRFSIWSDSDVDAGDFDGAGAINAASAGYQSWQEVHNVTPDTNGLFHVQLGSINTLPNFSHPTHVFLQVDVKAAALPDTSYETLDPDGNTANVNDRHPVNSVAFAINTDTVDGHDAGFNAGEIPYLDINSLLPVSTIPGGTNQNLFIIDSDNSVVAPGAIKLQFGSALAKVLEYDQLNNYFHFNDSLHVSGNLSATGNVDFSLATEFHMREVLDEAVAACTTVKELVLDTTENRIYVCTATGNPGTWSATDASSGAYGQNMVFEPEYNDAVITGDGSDNRGKIEVNYTDTDGDPGNANYNYYIWTTRQPNMQDMDLVIRAELPSGFSAWQAVPIEFTYRTLDGDAANNKIDVLLADTNGAAVSLNNASSLASAAWSTASITYNGAPVFTPGQPITIHIRLSAKDTGAAFAGKLTLHYSGI